MEGFKNKKERENTFKIKAKENLCKKFNCSECCNPVKIHTLSNFATNIKIWKERAGEFWAPKDSFEKTKLRIYDCENFNQQNGSCIDYENRPEACKNTFCRAYETNDPEEQKRLIDYIKNKKFFKIRK